MDHLISSHTKIPPGMIAAVDARLSVADPVRYDRPVEQAPIADRFRLEAADGSELEIELGAGLTRAHGTGRDGKTRELDITQSILFNSRREECHLVTLAFFESGAGYLTLRMSANPTARTLVCATVGEARRLTVGLDLSSAYYTGQAVLNVSRQDWPGYPTDETYPVSFGSNIAGLTIEELFPEELQRIGYFAPFLNELFAELAAELEELGAPAGIWPLQQGDLQTYSSHWSWTTGLRKTLLMAGGIMTGITCGVARSMPQPTVVAGCVLSLGLMFVANGFSTNSDQATNPTHAGDSQAPTPPSPQSGTTAPLPPDPPDQPKKKDQKKETPDASS